MSDINTSSHTTPELPLTLKEKSVLEFIESFISQNGIAPTFQEIKGHFGFASYNSVQRYLKQLQKKNYLNLLGGNQKRAIQVIQPSFATQQALAQVLALKQQKQHAVSTPAAAPRADGPSGELLLLPLLGKVAAGAPIEELEHNEYVEVPPSMVRQAESSFTLKIKGQSMIGDGIFDGDVIIVHKQSFAENGDIVVATVDNEATVKKFYLHRGLGLARPQVELRPSNPNIEPMWFSPDQIEIKGIVVGLLRKL